MSGIMRIDSINETENGTTPVGSGPEHWVGSWQDLEGGNDLYGVRPQCGVTLLHAEMNGLSYKSGYETAWDDVSNENLAPEVVQSARALEMEYFHKLGVYEKVARGHQVRTGGKIIGVRWVDVNEGNAPDTYYRSRLIGREFNVGRDDALYASTPPLEALRLIVSYAATQPLDGKRRMIMINDVRRASKEAPDHGRGIFG